MLIRCAMFTADAIDLFARMILRDDALAVGQPLLALLALAPCRSEREGHRRGLQEHQPKARPAPGDAWGAVEFSPLEMTVIALARRDPLSSLRYGGLLRRLSSALFGARHSPALADPRLETLRRVAVLGWRSVRQIPQAEMETFAAAGFRRAQLRDLLAITRDSRRRIPA